MNEDEAFIRAIVDNRGDETSRLVYADWLDDRADPRGPYLRAEVEWARTGKKEKPLRARAAGLDPVWVARVSRPPVGICADKIAMRSVHAPATAADLDAVERQLKVTLPAEYRALLMNWNGAAPAIGVPRQQPPLSLTEIRSFARIAVTKERGDRRDTVHLLEVVQNYRDCAARDSDRLRVRRQTGRIARTGDVALDYIPIAYGDDYGIYLIGIRGKAIGKVAYLYEYGHDGREPSDLEVCAPALGALLASIIAEAPEWYRHIKNGDTTGLLAWLEAGGDVNAEYKNTYDDKECPLTAAIGEKNTALVRELRARGAKVTRTIRAHAGYLWGPDKRKVLAALATKPTPKKKGKP